MQIPALRPVPSVPLDRCGHCDGRVTRVWLVPGEVLDSCRDCFVRATGSEPVHGHGHTTRPQPSRPYTPAPSATVFYAGAGRRRTA